MYVLFDDVSDQKRVISEDRTFLLLNPIEVITDASIELLEIIGGVYHDQSEVVKIKVVVLPAFSSQVTILVVLMIEGLLRLVLFIKPGELRSRGERYAFELLLIV